MPDNLISPSDLGFQCVARFGTRSELRNSGRKGIEGEAGERIAFIVFEDEQSQQLFASGAAATYMWIERDTDQPLYIGKANFGIKVRSGQHEGGFYGTSGERQKRDDRLQTGDRRDVTTGFGHARRIRKLWGDPAGRREIELWVRPSDMVDVFGSPVSLAAAEEERLIAIFQPPWNKEHKLDGV